MCGHFFIELELAHEDDTGLYMYYRAADGLAIPLPEAVLDRVNKHANSLFEARCCLCLLRKIFPPFMVFKTKYNEARPYIPNIKKSRDVGRNEECAREPQRITANHTKILLKLKNRDLFSDNMERLEYTENKSQIGRFSKY